MKITVNTDTEYVKEIRQKLKSNSNHCPCNLQIDDSTLCMCEDFINQKEDGYCHCGLYFKTNEEGD